MSNTKKIAVVQLTSGLECEENLNKIDRFLSDLEAGTDMVFLPECFYSMSDGTKPTPYLIEPGNEHYEKIRQLAIKHSVALLAGSVAALKDGKVVNRALNFDKDGNDLGHYDKNHLFSCDIVGKDGKKKSIDESDIYTPGNESKIINCLGVDIGLGICFDVRYPEMYRNYAVAGAKILTVSSAFTVPTGKAHWHTLVKARAIENQCFVVAPAQYGRHNERIQTFGHSLIVGPWGDVLADAQEGEKVITATLNFDEIERIRKTVKVFS